MGTGLSCRPSWLIFQWMGQKTEEFSSTSFAVYQPGWRTLDGVYPRPPQASQPLRVSLGHETPRLRRGSGLPRELSERTGPKRAHCVITCGHGVRSYIHVSFWCVRARAAHISHVVGLGHDESCRCC